MSSADEPNHKSLCRLASCFEIFGANPPEILDAGIAIAASRAGAKGLLNLSYVTNPVSAISHVRRLKELGGTNCGLILSGRLGEAEKAVLEELTEIDTILLTADAEAVLGEAVPLARAKAKSLGLIVTNLAGAKLADRFHFDFVVAKGHESGGWVGQETTFILLQQILQWGELPVCAWGGIGFNTAAACRAAGACGVVLDWQLSLLRESALPAAMRQRISAMDGSETIVLNGPQRLGLRLYAQPGFTAREKLQVLADSEFALEQ